MKVVRTLLTTIIVLAFGAWASAALWFDGPLSGSLAIGFIVAVCAVFAWVRPLRTAVFYFAGLFVVVIGWWLTIEASNDRQWLPDVARPPTATIEGDRLTIRNVRNFHYRTEQDFDENWEERTYDLSKLRGMDMFLSYWGSPWIAHTIASWEFDDGKHLAISIETRKEAEEAYSAVLGFFRQFELYYVIADERDVVGVRANHRNENVYLYRLRTPAVTARAILLDYLKEANQLAVDPRWYNAARHNCTTEIRHHMQNVSAANPLDWRIFVNGRIDELGYERGSIETGIPFDQLREQSEITQRANAAGSDANFSQRIREGLPGEHPPLHPTSPQISEANL